MDTRLSTRVTETFGSFRLRDFRLVWVSSNIAMAGLRMELIAVLWLVLELTGNPLLVGLAGSAHFGLAFVSLFTSAIIDRRPRHLLMAASHTVAAAMAFLLMFLLLFDGLQVWMIFVIVIGGGMFRTIEWPVADALIIDSVPPDRLNNAVALLGFGQNLMQFVGPVAAGFLFTPLTPAGLFGFIGALYLVGAALALQVRARNSTAGRLATPRETIIQVASGMRHVWHRKELFMALLISVLYHITGFPFTNALMPIFVKDTLNSGPEVLGLLNGAMGAGAVIGALVVAGLGSALGPGSHRRGWWLVWAVNGWHTSMILFAISIITLPGLLPFTAVLAILLAIKVLTGIGRAASLVLVTTVLMGNSDPEYRGRMGGMRVLSIQALLPASALNGWMVTQAGAPLTALTLGIGGSIAAFLCLLSRRLREA